MHDENDTNDAAGATAAITDGNTDTCCNDNAPINNAIPEFEMPDRIVAKDDKYEGMGGFRIDDEKDVVHIGNMASGGIHHRWAVGELNEMNETAWVDAALEDSEQGLEEWLKEK